MGARGPMEPRESSMTTLGSVTSLPRHLPPLPGSARRWRVQSPGSAVPFQRRPGTRRIGGRALVCAVRRRLAREGGVGVRGRRLQPARGRRHQHLAGAGRRGDPPQACGWAEVLAHDSATGSGGAGRGRRGVERESPRCLAHSFF